MKLILKDKEYKVVKHGKVSIIDIDRILKNRNIEAIKLFNRFYSIEKVKLAKG